MKLVDLPKYGPLHRFADYHVFRALLALQDGRRKGRKHLADSIGIGEGSMRTIVEYLRDRGLIDVKQTGVKVSAKGRDFLTQFPLEVKRLSPSDISVVRGKNVAVRVRGRSKRITLGIEQRDAAVKAGAAGATTVIVVGGKLIVPPDYDLDVEQPDQASELRSAFRLSEGDVVVIGTGPTFDSAEDGALAAAFEMI
jgi:predicted transcriptional regulator